MSPEPWIAATVRSVPTQTAPVRDGEHPADAADAEHGDRPRHVQPGVDDQVHVPRLGVDVERLEARFLPAGAGLLDPAEAHVRLAAVRPGVDDDDARRDPLGEPHRAVDARRVDRRGEAVGRVVRERDRLVEARDAVERRDRSEELVAGERRVGRDTLDERRRHVEAVAHRRRAPPASTTAPPAHAASTAARILSMAASEITGPMSPSAHVARARRSRKSS